MLNFLLEEELNKKCTVIENRLIPVVAALNESILNNINSIEHLSELLIETDLSANDIRSLFNTISSMRDNTIQKKEKRKKNREKIKKTLKKTSSSLKNKFSNILRKYKNENINESLTVDEKTINQFIDDRTAVCVAEIRRNVTDYGIYEKIQKNVFILVENAKLKPEQFPLFIAAIDFISLVSDLDGGISAAIVSNNLSEVVSSKDNSLVEKTNPLYDLNPFYKTRKIDAQDIYDAWESSGSPTDIEDIKELLKDIGFTPLEISRAFKKLHINPKIGDDPSITKLANAIDKAEMTDLVIDYMKKNKLTESVLIERKLSNKEIRKIFSLVVKELKKKKPDDNKINAEESVVTEALKLCESAMTEYRYGRNKRK